MVISTNNVRHCFSRLFQQKNVLPKNATVKKQDASSKSQRLMQDLGIISPANPGCFNFLPLGVRSLEKLMRLIDEEMVKLGGQKMIFPSFIHTKLWKTSGRLQEATELFQLKDRHNQQYILGPTHEEVAAHILASATPMPYKHFPLRLYQITSKYRDEMKPRFGLMRAKEFIMKDMYSFDVDVESAKETYEAVCESYNSIFDTIGVNYLKVLGSSGSIGGSLSHEYHFRSDVGEDKVFHCTNCNYAANVDVVGENINTCPQCKKNDAVQIRTGIEVGHTFFLGDRYSKPLNAIYLSREAKPVLLQMGSYGLGVSRIIAAVIEVLSFDQEIRWPDILAPFNVVIIPPKAGSNEELQSRGVSEKIYDQLERLPYLKNNIILDDRTTLTIGKRFLEAKRLGIRFIIVIGKKYLEDPPLYEINDLKLNTQLHLNEIDLLNFISKNFIK